MSKLRLKISLSLDGYVAGPRQSLKDPLGVGGLRLHQWVFGLRSWRALHGLPGGVENASDAVVAESMAGIGATIMGRNMFGGGPGPWRADEPWNGWWGDDPPFRHPVFVLTHHPRAPLELGATTFHFVTEGVAAALARARTAAGDADVTMAGGAATARQYLAAGAVDEMELNQVPILLGAGERLLEGLGDDLHGLKLVRTVATPEVVHLKFARGTG